MKKIIITAILGCIAVAVNAQDIIVLRNAEEIQAKVENVSKDKVSYRKWTNLDGPLYTIDASSILFIKYENGQKDIFNNTEASSTAAATSAATGTAAEKKSGGNPYPAGKTRLQGYFNVGGLFGSRLGPSTDLSVGVRIRNYTYIGAQVGCDVYFAQKLSNTYEYEHWLIPVGGDLKCYIPTNGKWFPYTDLMLGVAVIDGKRTEFYNYLGFGVDLGHLSLGIGWSHTSHYYDQFAVKVGFRFGK